jgi:hypothetical protein
MATKSLALVGSRFREQKDLHIAEWAAQLVCGYRALRRLVDAGSIAAGESISIGVRMMDPSRDTPALPGHRASAP